MVWCLGLTGEAAVVVKLWVFVLDLLLRFARASSGAGGEDSRGSYRSVFSSGSDPAQGG